MDSSFRAVITVTEDGKVSGKVIDLMNSEEYEKLHLINFTGAYISKVRNSYMDILNDIALSCTDNLYFFLIRQIVLQKKFMKSMKYILISLGKMKRIEMRELSDIPIQESGLRL